ncbi:zinc finger CDGSH-type [Salpingoeca rosetta]|uniref:Zinc finger CDGSH-type n=1 Tax=Salpingoeca rosetta (strain ATCC 50818 / BSB-021) TaxID=946362 RepID=F2URQ9_SALR5|nr:zinc finger CDGSH-type [Salpingoeca rosetta]EGD80314.1 zinc finger CDGSH-type [Salpingoeca rosetta]|eukprot:XP_004988104.1 zinc finger CDGSH-type [Salpingoeca rosetta]
MKIFTIFLHSHHEARTMSSKKKTQQQPEGPVPIVAAGHSKKVQLEEGKTYFWCACGRSQNQPFCDGSHKGTGFEPLKFVAEKTEVRGLCQCKFTKKPPFCDGMHRDPSVLKTYNQQLLRRNSELVGEVAAMKRQMQLLTAAVVAIAAGATAFAWHRSTR